MLSVACISFFIGISELVLFKNTISLNLRLRGMNSVVPYVTAHEQTQKQTFRSKSATQILEPGVVKVKKF